MSNYLICWEENNIKKWNMVKEDDHQSFLMNLLLDEKVNQSSIFVIPTTGISGIWLDSGSHKSNRVDFWNFFEDYGSTYTKPVPKKEQKLRCEKFRNVIVITQSMVLSLRKENTFIVDTKVMPPWQTIFVLEW